MKRRDFVRAAVSLPLVSELGTNFSEKVDYFDEDYFPQSPSADREYDLHFMAIGDWGRNGEYLQAELADQMGLWATKNRTQFVISTGDNFYPKGVVSERDPLWNFSFENVYRAHALQCDWYPVLGNHDYGSDPDAQVRYSEVSRRWKMPARYYSKAISMGRGKGTALFVMLDTNSMIDSSRAVETQAQLGWLDATLSQASADVKWKIVVGHHPAYTVGPRIEHRQVFVMRDTLTELFNRHKVDLYLSGHEHSMQHLKPDGFTHQVVSGAGSELTPVKSGVSYSKFEASVNGFLYASLNAEKLNMQMVDYTGKVLYNKSIAK
jgi:tartrate-resistant acid phosphatase type 5